MPKPSIKPFVYRTPATSVFDLVYYRTQMQADPHNDKLADWYSEKQKLFTRNYMTDADTMYQKAVVLVELANDVDCDVSATMMRQVAVDIFALLETIANLRTQAENCNSANDQVAA